MRTALTAVIASLMIGWATLTAADAGQFSGYAQVQGGAGIVVNICLWNPGPQTVTIGTLIIGEGVIGGSISAPSTYVPVEIRPITASCGYLAGTGGMNDTLGGPAPVASIHASVGAVLGGPELYGFQVVGDNIMREYPNRSFVLPPNTGLNVIGFNPATLSTVGFIWTEQ